MELVQIHTASMGVDSGSLATGFLVCNYQECPKVQDVLLHSNSF